MLRILVGGSQHWWADQILTIWDSQPTVRVVSHPSSSGLPASRARLRKCKCNWLVFITSSHFSPNTEQQWENGSICWWWQGRTEHVSRITVTRLLHCDISSVSLPFIANYWLNSTVNRQPGSTSREKIKDLVLSSLEQRRETGAAGGNIAIKLDCREHNDLSCWDKLFIGLVWQVIIR